MDMALKIEFIPKRKIEKKKLQWVMKIVGGGFLCID